MTVHEAEVPTHRGWRYIERHTYVERAYGDVRDWLAGHLSTIGAPLPGGGHSVELRLRPGGMELTRPVRLHVAALVPENGRARADLGWADAARPNLFPHLKGVLEVTPVPNASTPFTQLGVKAWYRPPFGPLGAIGDRLIGADVTDAALTTFLEELAEAVADHTTPPSLRTEPDHPETVRHPQYGPEIQRLLLTVDGLVVRRGGAVGVCEALRAVPGVVDVSIDPWAGLVAVDHDPEACAADDLVAALEAEVPAAPSPG